MVIALLLVTVGSTIYAGLVVAAAWRYRAVRPVRAPVLPPVSVLKPLHGLDEGLEENLRSFFEQDYPAFELLFAVRTPADPAAAVVERLRRAYPGVASRLVIVGEPACPNAKVHSLDRLVAAAANDLLIMADSDVRVRPDLLRTIAAEMQDARVGLVTCPYRAVPGRGPWSTLEAIGINTEFIAGVLVARLVEGMRFALGPALAVRRHALADIGGMARLETCLAEDFVLGQLVAAAGFTVLLSSAVVDHRIGGETFTANLRHRLRWNRSTRRSRPWGYVGQLFTYPLPFAIALWVVAPAWWLMAAAALAARGLAAWSTAGPLLQDPLTRRRWFLLPVQDVASALTWVAGFFGRNIEWRGRRYRLKNDGTVERVGV